MNADIELGILARQFHGVVEGGASGHDGGSSENPVAVSLDDAFVDVASEAEIVGVGNQQSQNIASLMRRNFFGLARKSFIRRCISRVVPLRLSYNCGLTSSCPSVPCPALILSSMTSIFARESDICLCSSSLLSSLPAVPWPALRPFTSLFSPSIVSWAESYSWLSFSSFPAVPSPFCRPSSRLSTRPMVF